MSKTEIKFDFLPDYAGKDKGIVMQRILHLIEIAYAEDVGPGDVTTEGTVDRKVQAVGRFLAKADGIVAGIHIARLVFAVIDPSLKVHFTHEDGDQVTSGTYFGTVSGAAHSVIQAERLALNLMQRMSGIATLTNAMVRECKGTNTRVLDTRKTVPGLRDLDKLAVRCGGGTNHRMGLHDMVMIKDNHITASGGLIPALRAVKRHLAASKKTHIPIEVEARTLEEVRDVVQEGGIERVLLDNMVKVTRGARGEITSIDTSMLQAAVSLVNGAFDTEASGNITLDTIGTIARETGVTHASCGALTHSVMALDISLKIKLSSHL